MNLRVPPRFVLLAAFALLSVPLWAQGNDPLLDNPVFRKPLHPLTPSQRGVVFGLPDVAELGKQCSRQSPTGWWSSVPPSKVEIKTLEAALPGWIKTHQLQNWKASFASFHYQYGALVRGKKRLIYVNALPMGDEFGGKAQLWRRVPEVVCDGGSYFWGIEFDVARKRFQNVSFNGPA